ncbi:MAG: NapC/NirT family cytochrome c [Deferribacteres bacterium]|nr:NapC/NirT family cytochrome c [candidate division KSB1 bacterium]MCB9500971.1 NapC/NirT family cytochrome c [Deferribacteres bacterium]
MEKQKRKYSESFYNFTSLAGAVLAGVIFCIIILLILLDAFSPSETPYYGILTYIILPVFLIIGLVLIPMGALKERRRRQKGLKAQKLPKIDLNNPQHMRSVIFFVTGTCILALFTSLGTYRAFEFTESITFCGQVCHDVMKPEFTAYQNSPHARVSCVDCHVGHGAEWYVRSKLSGAYQVYSVLFNKYERPIPTPIHNLRPARETCEQCHWPQKFYGKKQKDRIHFMEDEQNTRWKYSLLLRIGGGSGRDVTKESSIHWHINNKVEYYASDDRRQTIPWVRFVDKNGFTHEFKSEDLGDEVPPASEIRTMDCIDCHNRPSHIYQYPQFTINTAMESGAISIDLPEIKSKSMEILQAIESDTTTEQGLKRIKEELTTFYEEDYPEINEEKKSQVDAAVLALQDIFQKNYFPEMRANWRNYPNNIGHISAPGCYRCHDGMHSTEDGKVISNDCNVCHLIVEQGNGEFMQSDINGVEFKHPEDIDEEWREEGCYSCHAE